MSTENKELEAKKQEKIDLTNALKDARKELVKFRKANGLKAGEEPEDAKLQKTLKKLTQAVQAQEKELDRVKEELKEMRPKRGFTTKYTYPTVVDEKTGEEREMTKAEKKRFRAKARAKKKKAEKGEDTPKKVKASKKEEKTEKVKTKKKKAAPVEEEEDED